MTPCPDEQHTRHWLGPWHGFGTVQDGEHVLFAVFSDTSRDGDVLNQKSFTKNLNNTTQSLARESYITRQVFNRKIVGTRTLHGVAIAHVKQLRQLQADLNVHNTMTKVRALCVIDLVEVGDCEGHATMGFSEQVSNSGISKEALGKARQRIKLDLAEIFSGIAPAETLCWRNGIQVLLGRANCIKRIFWSLLVKRIGTLIGR